MTTETHTPGTPLPWKADHADLCQVRGGNLLAIARMTAGFHDQEKAEQDAAYAAHACNLYPELLEALGLASAVLSDAAENGYYIGEGVFDKVNAVLAKARGGAS